MNTSALLAFGAIVLEGSAAATARQLNRSQFSTSRLIAYLEHDLKLPLFHRTRRRLVLTNDGQAFFRETERILSGLHEIPLIGADIRQRRNTDLRLVAMPRVVSGWLAPATAEFRKLHPGIRINIDVQRRHDMVNCLAGRRYEFGVGTLPAQHAAIDTVMIFRAPMGAVVARNHPLARCKRIAASDLLDHTLIGMSPGLLPREQMDAILGTVAAKPPYDIETSATYLARKLAAQGAGVTLIDTISAAVTDIRTVVVPLEPRAWVTFGLLKPKGAPYNPATRLYVKQLRTVSVRLVESHQVELV